MPTKISLALGRREPLSRQTAWGYFTTNLAMPGFGSILAGYKTGYVQAVVGIVGLIVTTIFGVQSIIWFISHWSQLQQSQDYPGDYLSTVWLRLRWALLGIGIFGIGWVWSLGTGLLILNNAKSTVPPKL